MRRLVSSQTSGSRPRIRWPSAESGWVFGENRVGADLIDAGGLFRDASASRCPVQAAANKASDFSRLNTTISG